jgi:DNA-binding NtrC family response regulator
VLLLADHLLSGLGSDKRLSADAREAILAHSWPGNVRELKNTIARAAVLSRGELIDPSDLGLTAPRSLRPTSAAGRAAPGLAPDHVQIPTNATLAEAERLLIQHALARFDNNRTHAAKALGIATKTLYNKLKALAP